MFQRTEICNFVKAQFISSFDYGLLIFYHVRNLCLSEDHKNVLMFTSRSIIVLALKFRSVIHFQVIFVSEVKVKILF